MNRFGVQAQLMREVAAKIRKLDAEHPDAQACDDICKRFLWAVVIDMPNMVFGVPNHREEVVMVSKALWMIRKSSADSAAKIISLLSEHCEGLAGFWDNVNERGLNNEQC